MAHEKVLIRPLGGAWGQIGADILPGVVPENLTASANEWGSDTATFLLHRDPTIPWPDLVPFCPVDIHKYGLKFWSGRVESVGGDNGDGTVSVTCKGWQYHLDDDIARKFYVHESLTNGWKDWRSNLAADLTTWTTAIQVEAGEGGIILTRPAGASGSANALSYFDAGPGMLVKRVVITWNKVSGSTHDLRFRAGRTTAELNSGFVDNRISNATGTTSGTYTYTLPTPCRYVGIQFGQSGGNSADEFARASSAVLFGETSYESGGASDFTLDELVKDIRSTAPLLSTSNDKIDTFTYGIPELDPQRRMTPRELIALGQEFHDVRLQVDVDQKLVAQLRPSAPRFEVGPWSRRAFKDGTISGESLVSGVIVEGQTGAGDPIEVERDAQDVSASMSTLPDRQGFAKRKAIPVQSTVTQALGERLADVYIGGHMTAPMKGEQVIGVGDAREIATGRPVDPTEFLINTEELLRFSDRIDPDTGGFGRDGRMKTVTYNADSEEATVSIDNDSRRFEAQLARMEGAVK